MQKIYTLEQVAEILQVSIVTIRRYIKSGKLRASKIGKEYRVTESDVIHLLESLKVNNS